MNASLLASGAWPLLLDTIPVLALAALAAAFLRGRSRCRREEKELIEAIRAFAADEEEGKTNE